MKKYLYLSGLFIFLMVGCNRSDKTESNQTVVEEPVDTIEEVEDSVDSSENGLSIINIPSLWTIETQSDNTEKLIPPTVKKVSAPESMVRDLNANYPDIHIVFNKLSHDTMYIDIPESSNLTEGIGSTGAYNYLATAVYSLTETKGIRYVNFKFQVGEHASPGTYERDDFKRLR